MDHLEIYNEAPHGDMVFALARGVATVVTIAALTLIMVLLIIAKAVLMATSEKIGLIYVIIIVLCTIVLIGKNLNLNLKALTRVLLI